MKTYTNSELCLIWLDSFIGLEYKHKIELYKYINGKTDLKSLIEKGEDYIKSRVGEKEFKTLLSSANSVYMDHVINGLNNRELVAVTLESRDYPESLKNTPCPPLVLYAKGNVKLLSEKCFSIVGSRKSLPLSIKIAEDFSERLIEGGFTLVTGIAEGVDSAVLRTAVQKGSKVISVIAGGIDNVYPKSNFELLSKVAEVGLVIAEYPPETVPMRFHFPVRNRIIAALSVGTLIVSGGRKSGTIYTAEYAMEYGRELFAIPYSVGIPSGVGCNELIKRGANLADAPEDILEFFGIKTEKEKKLELNELEKEIVNALKSGEMHIEKLCQTLNKRVFEITPQLSILEMKKLVYRSGNAYGLSRGDLEE